jgi:putative protease
MSPELLAPAGSLTSMRFAFAYGADAIYAGKPRYSLRVRENDFHKDEALASAIEEAHSLGKLFFLAANLAPHNDKIRSFIRDMEPIVAMKPDALIMSDPGLIMLARERWPDQPIHLSVQANAVNWATVRFWQQQGISRVILSRELSLEEIGEIREAVPDIELEVFVHGALCIAYSGRCLLSGYMNHRDANQGACTNACRWQYKVRSGVETLEGNVVSAFPAEDDRSAGDRVFLLQEINRPNENLAAYEDEHGTYIMNSRDLRAIQHVEQLYRMGIHSLKIEGRTKSHFYVARTTQLYRQAIDDAVAGRPFDQRLMSQLEGLNHRGYTEGFYRRHPPAEYQYYNSGNGEARQQFVGQVIDSDPAQGRITVEVKNRFAVGDQMELMTPEGNTRFRLESIENIANGVGLLVAPGDGYRVSLPVPESVWPLRDNGVWGILIRDREDQP